MLEMSRISPPVQPPVGLEMPATPQLVFEIILAIGAIYTIIYCVRMSIQQKTWVPLCLLVSAIVMLPVEVFYDLMMLAIYPEVGQNVAISAMNRDIPVFIFLAYAGSFVVPILMLGDKVVNAEKGYLTKLFCAFAVGLVLYELLPIYFGLWVYYGEHKFVIGGYPTYIALHNTASYITTIVAFGLLKPLLTGYRQIFALFLLPVCYTMGMSGVGIFAAVGLNSTAGDWAIYAGIAGSVLGSIFLVWLLEQLLDGARRYRKLVGDVG